MDSDPQPTLTSAHLRECSPHPRTPNDEALQFLNDNDSTPYGYWEFEDNSLFHGVNMESVRESVNFISSREEEYQPGDYRGEWLHVNDHGNATLYYRDDPRPNAGEEYNDKEIWAIV